MRLMRLENRLPASLVMHAYRHSATAAALRLAAARILNDVAFGYCRRAIATMQDFDAT